MLRGAASRSGIEEARRLHMRVAEVRMAGKNKKGGSSGSQQTGQGKGKSKGK